MGIFTILLLLFLLIPLLIVSIPVILSFLIRGNIRNIQSFERKDERLRNRKRGKKGNVYISKYPSHKQVLNTEGIGKYVNFKDVKEEK